MSESLDHSLAELMIVASARLWRDDGEVLATGIGTAAARGRLARLAYNNGLMLTDGEAYLVEEPVPPALPRRLSREGERLDDL